MIVEESFIKEFTDKRKAASNHLSSLGRKLSQIKATPEEKLAGLDIYANNNIFKSVFSRLTKALTKSSILPLTHTSVLSQSK